MDRTHDPARTPLRGFLAAKVAQPTTITPFVRERFQMKTLPLGAIALCAVLVTSSLSGCALALVGGAAAATGLVMTDRRDARTQLDDTTIDGTTAREVRQILGDKGGHVTTTSYFRKVLITGEVPNEETRQRVVAAVQQTRDVAGVVDELAVMPDSSLKQRAEDSAITARVKANLVNTTGVPSNSIKVLTDRGTTYLMGRLTRRETELATEAARTTPGVQRVVRVIDYISDQAALHPGDVGAGAAPVSSATPAADTATQDSAPMTPVQGASTYPVSQSPVIRQPPVEVKALPPAK
jgi:osmotically-inducible protein OsmY